MTRKSRKGRVSYTARVRRTGGPHVAATFYCKNDALKFIEQQEVAIQRLRHLKTKTKRKQSKD